jgi:hypothetical protein
MILDIIFNLLPVRVIFLLKRFAPNGMNMFNDPVDISVVVSIFAVSKWFCKLAVRQLFNAPWTKLRASVQVLFHTIVPNHPATGWEERQNYIYHLP